MAKKNRATAGVLTGSGVDDAIVRAQRAFRRKYRIDGKRGSKIAQKVRGGVMTWNKKGEEAIAKMDKMFTELRQLNGVVASTATFVPDSDGE